MSALTLFPLWQSVSRRKLGVYTCINFVNKFFFWVCVYICVCVCVYIYVCNIYTHTHTRFFFFFFGWRLLGLRGFRMIMGAAKDERGSVFRNTKFLAVESRPLWGPYVGKGPRSLGFTVCCYTVSSSTFGGGLSEGARKLQKPII